MLCNICFNNNRNIATQKLQHKNCLFVNVKDNYSCTYFEKSRNVTKTNVNATLCVRILWFFRSANARKWTSLPCKNKMKTYLRLARDKCRCSSFYYFEAKRCRVDFTTWIPTAVLLQSSVKYCHCHETRIPVLNLDKIKSTWFSFCVIFPTNTLLPVLFFTWDTKSTVCVRACVCQEILFYNRELYVCHHIFILLTSSHVICCRHFFSSKYILAFSSR